MYFSPPPPEGTEKCILENMKENKEKQNKKKLLSKKK